MPEKKIIRLAHDHARQIAADLCRTVPDGWIVAFKEPTRSLDQNAMLWALLTDISRQVLWPVDGEMTRLPPEDWKDIFTAGLNRSQRAAKGIDGGFVMLGSRTSKMGKREFSDLCELILAFGAERGVRWSDERAAA